MTRHHTIDTVVHHTNTIDTKVHHTVDTVVHHTNTIDTAVHYTIDTVVHYTVDTVVPSGAGCSHTN